MMDLFGDTHCQPNTAPPRRILNGAHGFSEWWKAWPAHHRKSDKQKCLDRWSKQGYAECASHIAAYLEWAKTSPDWTKDAGAFIPAPIVWLRREGWVDWEPVEIPKRPHIDPALVKIACDRAAATPMPAEVRQRLAALRRGA